MAQRQVLKWIPKRDAWNAKHGPKPCHPPVTAHVSPDPDNADTALVLLGIATPDPARANLGGKRAHLLVELWAAQMALSRRRGGQRLTDEQRRDILRCTRDAKLLRWPRGTDE